METTTATDTSPGTTGRAPDQPSPHSRIVVLGWAGVFAAGVAAAALAVATLATDTGDHPGSAVTPAPPAADSSDSGLVNPWAAGDAAVERYLSELNPECDAADRTSP